MFFSCRDREGIITNSMNEERGLKKIRWAHSNERGSIDIRQAALETPVASGVFGDRSFPEPSEFFPKPRPCIKLRPLSYGIRTTRIHEQSSEGESASSQPGSHPGRKRPSGGSVMACTVASRRAVLLVRALEKLLAASSAPGAASAVRPVAVAGGLRRYNTGAQLRRYEGAESEDDSVREYESRRGSRDYAVPSLFSGSRNLRAMPDSFASFSQMR
jgi:hypothetical protein